MTGLTITSNTTNGYLLGPTTLNPITVASGVTITDTNFPALASSLATNWTIVNAGTLLASGKNIISDGIALLGAAVSSIANLQAGSVTGYYAGISVASRGSITNQGVIATTGTSGAGFQYINNLFTATSAGILLGSGQVSNAAHGLISSYWEGIAIGGAGSVVNAGTIRATGTANGFGVVLTAGGSIVNVQGGSIAGAKDGVLAFGPSATLTNQGSISGNLVGVGLESGGMLTNAAGAEIFGVNTGVRSFGANAASVTNAAGGTLAGGSYGFFAEPGGTATLTNAGLLSGQSGAGAVLLDPGRLDNILGGTIVGGIFGIYIGGTSAAAVTNAGSVGGYRFGVQVNGTPGTVVNSGHIADTQTLAGAGVQLVAGGLVTNNAGGTIASQWMGVQIGTGTSSVGGTVVNQGTIHAADTLGDGAGVWIHGPGAIVNGSGGIISGGAFGVVAYYQTTVVNQGTIFGTGFAFDAVHSGFANRVIDTSTGVFIGTVAGGNSLGSAIYSTLELASGSSVGTIANIGSFTGFGRIALDNGATWSVGGSMAAGETLAFGGPNATLILASPSAAASTIAGFVATDTIVLAGVADVTGLAFNGNTLTIAESTGPGLTLTFAAPLALTRTVTNGSTDISVVPCFLPGTHILTSQGEVPVEKLRIGDTIVTAGGDRRRLCWIGHGRTLAARGRRSAATPVIVRKGALAANVPARDLRITKGHSLYLDGVLIPVEFLVNHRSILWDDRAQDVTVYHLELDAHDILVADGAHAESYRDDGNRWLFQNTNEGWSGTPQPPCAPVLTGGAQVDAIWRRILDRAGPRPGLPLTDDPDLHLLAGGARIDAAKRQGSVYVFSLHAPPAGLHIVSRDAVPAELGLARDARPLGVALRQIAIRQGTRFTVLQAADTRLTDGFHGYEAAEDLRWTDGDATLPSELFARFAGEMEVVLHLAGTTRYREDGPASAMA